MKGILFQPSHPSKIQYAEVARPVCNPDEVLVRVKAAALNHRDEWCRQGLYPNLKEGIVLGSDGAGVVEEIGSEVNPSFLGKEVIINPALHWGSNPRAQGAEFEILGMPRNGTFAEFVAVPVDRIHSKPIHFSWEEAAAFPLAALTAYRAVVVQGGVTSKDKVLVTGIGGGVALFALQIAHALGATVLVSSSSEDKLAKAKKLGASFGFNYTTPTWTTALLQQTGGVDVVIDGTSGDTLSSLMSVGVPGARLVFYGATRGNPPQLEARKLFWNQLKLIGSTMGSDTDFIRVLELFTSATLRPTIDQVFSLADAEHAFDRMKRGEQLGKIILVP